MAAVVVLTVKCGLSYAAMLYSTSLQFFAMQQLLKLLIIILHDFDTYSKSI